MSETVEIPFGDKPSETAILLLAAVEELSLSPAVVRTTDGAFVVPPEVSKKAFNRDEKKTEAKKAPAKKASAKRSE